MSRNPKDTLERRTGSRARAIVHHAIDSNHWDYREETGNDYGRDCILELSEEECWNNRKVEGQIKGTKNPHFIFGGSFLSISIETKTIRYALGSSKAFILFYVDVDNEVVYCQPLQEYFLCHHELFERLDTQLSLAIRIPADNQLPQYDEVLCNLARYTYIYRPSNGLQRIDK